MRWRARRLTLLLPWTLVAGVTWAGPEGLPIVNAAQQAQRDTARLQILRLELAAEEQGLARSLARRAQRAAANDVQGVAEAEQVYEEHTRNVQALRAEIDRAGPRTPPRTSAPRPRPAGPPVDPPARPWWDAYRSPP